MNVIEDQCVAGPDGDLCPDSAHGAADARNRAARLSAASLVVGTALAGGGIALAVAW
jgi:hypothetical protein